MSENIKPSYPYSYEIASHQKKKILAINKTTYKGLKGKANTLVMAT